MITVLIATLFAGAAAGRYLAGLGLTVASTLAIVLIGLTSMQWGDGLPATLLMLLAGIFSYNIALGLGFLLRRAAYRRPVHRQAARVAARVDTGSASNTGEF